MRWLIALGATLTLVMTGCGGDESTGGGGGNPADVTPPVEVTQDAGIEDTTADGVVPDAQVAPGDIDASTDVGPDGEEGDGVDVAEPDVSDGDTGPDVNPSQPGGPCLEHSDCASDFFCINYECHGEEDGVGQPCGSDADCVEGLFCVDNQCGDKPIACGDGVIDEGEECDDGTANSDILPNTCREGCVLPSCGDGVADTGEGCDDANLDETDGCSMICVTNSVYDKPQAGELVITELMINPAVTSDPFGEWIEVHNVTDQSLSLVDCEVHDQGTDVIVLGESTGYLVIEPGQHLVLGFSDDLSKNGGVDVDVTYGTMLLDNVTDEVAISCPSGVVDEVAYGTVLFPIQSGASMSLDGTSVDAAANDLPFSWCPGSQIYGAGDYGTPGQANPPCPEADVTLDHCEVASASEITHILGTPVGLVVHVTEAGLTDQSSGVDTTAALWVQVGFGPPDSVPTDDGWTWGLASPVDDWDNEAGTDAHLGALDPDQTGLWHGAARVSLDAGQTWTHCDLPPGSEDGYQGEAAVQVNTIEDPCLAAVCDAPPESTCVSDGITAHIFDAADATCSVEDWAAVCAYPPQIEDCGHQGLVCEGDGVCVDGAVAAPAPGEVILNELMLQPTQVSAGVGVWVELHNASESILDLEGCTVGYAGGSAVTISTPLLIAAGGFRVLAPTTSESGNGGIPADFAYGNALTLSLAPSALQVQCDGAVVDELSYSPVDWPIISGASLSLSPYHADSDENDLVAWWCLAQVPYGAGDLGTPGAANPACVGDEEPIDDCRIEGPAQVEALAGAALAVAGYVVEAGITDLSPQTDSSESMVVEAGWGPVGDAPDGDTWTWTAAQPDPEWTADEGAGSALEDRWEALMDAPPAGSYAALVRASADGGHTWTTCDLDGAVNGLDLAQSVTVATSPSACDPSPCLEPPTPACDGTIVVDWETPVFCSVVDDGTECAWTPLAVEDCADEGAECEAGVCVNYPEVPGPGDLVISELLVVPSSGESGEWIELAHVGSDPITLTGCSLESGAGQAWSFVAETPLEAVVLPGEFVVAARAAESETLSPDFVYGEALSLGNASDEVRLMCDDAEVDAVAWDQSGGWSIPVHTTLSLSGNRLNGVDNDLSSAWCSGPSDGEGIPGSSGESNPLCPSLDGVIEGCVLEGPISLIVDHGGDAEVGVRLEDVGTTDASPGVDPAPGIGAEVGYGPSGTIPGEGWAWFSAAPDETWDDGTAPGEDRWLGSVVGQKSGQWDVAARVTADFGASWVLCDIDGSADGYDPAFAGIFEVGQSACDPNPCVTPPSATCLGTLLQIPVSPGTCTEDEAEESVCEYGEVTFDCALYDGCDAGVCLSPPGTPWSPGQLVITEVHRDSQQASPDGGEWIEIYNGSGSAWDVRSCALGDLGGESWVIADPAPVVVKDGEFMVIGAALDLGVGLEGVAELVWSGFSLDNLFDEVILTCGGTQIDAVSWTPDWPGDEGVAMQLKTSKTNATLNDDVESWCAADSVIGDSGELGTPGEENTPCP